MFPEIDARNIAFEKPVYYVQHGLMFVIPVYLMKQGGNLFTILMVKMFLNFPKISGAYNVEALNDFSWNMTGYSINLIYHFSFLEIFALVSVQN